MTKKIHIAGFHLTSLKLLIFLRFYFHDVQEQLKTNIHTNFHSEWVLGLVIDYACISKLLRDVASHDHTLFSFIFAALKFRENFLGTFRESLIS